MTNDIDTQLTAYFAWMESQIGFDLHPPITSGEAALDLHPPVTVDLRMHEGGRRSLVVRLAVVATLIAASIVGLLIITDRPSSHPVTPAQTGVDGAASNDTATNGTEINDTATTVQLSTDTRVGPALATNPASIMPAGTLFSTTTDTRPVIGTLAIGESVMQGVQNVLPDHGVLVDAQESIQGRGMIDAIRTAREQYRITDSVVIQSGTNGPVTQGQYDEMATLLADLPHVYFMTIKAPLGWVAGNNAKIATLPSTHPNVTVIDWATLGAQLPPADLSVSDGGIHLNSDLAVRFYANLILGALGKPLIPEP